MSAVAALGWTAWSIAGCPAMPTPRMVGGWWSCRLPIAELARRRRCSETHGGSAHRVAVTALAREQIAPQTRTATWGRTGQVAGAGTGYGGDADAVPRLGGLGIGAGREAVPRPGALRSTRPEVVLGKGLPAVEAVGKGRLFHRWAPASGGNGGNGVGIRRSTHGVGRPQEHRRHRERQLLRWAGAMGTGAVRIRR